MKKLFVIILTLAITGLGAIAQNADYEKGEVIIQLNWQKKIDKVVSELNRDLKSENAVEIKKVLSRRLNIWLLEFEEGTHDINRIISTANRNGDVYAAQKNHFVAKRVTVPNDPLYNTMWDMDNIGQTGGTNDADIDAPEAWDITTGGLTVLGDTIVVAVIDGGFDITHEDLNFWKNRNEIPGNSIDDDGNGYVDDYDGWDAYDSDGSIPSDAHGTHVSGTVGAIGDNGIGVVGVNWNVRVMPVAGSSGNESTVVEAYGYVYELRATYNETNGDSGAFVVSTNSSFGVNNGDPAQYPIWCGFYDSLGSVGVLSCGATMNVNADVDQTGDIPTACPSPYMISVTNTDKDDQKNNGAAYGLTTIDLGAPGTEINSTIPGNGYSDSYTGTSMATPHVAGAIGLLYSVPCASLAAMSIASPEVAAMQVRQYIFDGVDVISSLTGITVTDGRLNLYNSVLEVMSNCSTSPCPMPYSLGVSAITNTDAVMSWSTLADSSFNIRYAEQGDTNWITASTNNLSYALTGLTGCTAYEFQIETVCDTINSGYTTSYIFTTDGCCSAPGGLATSGITDNSASLTWDVVVAATGYNVQFKPTSGSTWTSFTGVSTTTQLVSTLTPCTEYEFQIQTICDTGISVYSPSFEFTSTCGTCTANNYCVSVGDDTSDEWIEAVSFNSLVNVSGDDNGSGDYTSLTTMLAVDSTYTMMLTPGYSSFQYDELFGVWIDFNQDGDFDELDELVYESLAATQTAITTDITIPSTAPTGNTRMRISMKYDAAPAACEASFSYGEVEDYCVSIINPTDTGLGISGANQANLFSFSLRPNPAGDNVLVDLNGIQAYRVSIVTLLGREILEAQVESTTLTVALSLNELANGIYLVKVETKDRTYTKRLVHTD